MDKCENFGLIDGESRTKITWECFPNNTKICTTRNEDCTFCDGRLHISSLTCPSSVCKTPEPKTQAGSIRRGRFRFKREVSARGRWSRRSPSFGRGEIEDSEKAKKEAEDGKAEVDTDKKETDAGKEDTEPVKEETTRIVKGVPHWQFNCNDVCLEKNGKYSKGQFEYTSFKDCEGGSKTEELKDQKEEENKDENKNEADDEPENYQKEKDKDEKKAKDKEVKDENKKAARRRRMKRYRF